MLVEQPTAIGVSTRILGVRNLSQYRIVRVRYEVGGLPRQHLEGVLVTRPCKKPRMEWNRIQITPGLVGPDMRTGRVFKELTLPVALSPFIIE
jgi:hypothetical protein